MTKPLRIPPAANQAEYHQRVLGGVLCSDAVVGILEDCADSFSRILFMSDAGDMDRISEVARIELAHLRYFMNVSEVEPPERPA